jgi:hypothetical protein
MAISASARWLRVNPRRSAWPCSVTMTAVSLRGVLTGPDRVATMRLAGPAVAGNMMIGTPPGEAAAPRRKSTAPPTAPT